MGSAVSSADLADLDLSLAQDLLSPDHMYSHGCQTKLSPPLYLRLTLFGPDRAGTDPSSQDLKPGTA